MFHKKKGVKVELIQAYRYYLGQDSTYCTPTTLTRISRKGKTLFYIEPYGDYEYNGGHHCRVLSEKDFRLGYSEHYKGT